MAKFLKGNELNFELEKILEEAQECLILISPFIRIHDRYASSLLTKRENDRVMITIVFGKNEEDISKSMKQEDFNFFKEFPNIEIRYEKRLHAKYYANETTAILTSMNLYSYSQDNNIEAGIMTKASWFGFSGGENVDQQAYEYFDRVINQSELLYQKIPQYERSMMGLAHRYIGSKVEVDKLSDFFTNRVKYESINHTKGYDSEKNTTQQKTNMKIVKSGFCIRTGKPIPFNLNRPFCDEAYQNWAKFGNEKYPEKFCHFSGENSSGETSKAKPILGKNWNEAKKNF